MTKTLIVSLLIFASTQSQAATTGSIVICEALSNVYSSTESLNEQIRKAEKSGYRKISAPSISPLAICVTASAEVNSK